jgi:hypothetical protein
MISVKQILKPLPTSDTSVLQLIDEASLPLRGPVGPLEAFPE